MANYQRGSGQGGRASFNGSRDHQGYSNSMNGMNDSFNRGMPQSRMNPWDISPSNMGGNSMGGNSMGNNNLGGNMMGGNMMGGSMMGGNIMNNVGSNRPSGGLLPTPNMPAMTGLLETPNMSNVQLAKMLSILQNQQTNQMPSLLGPSPNCAGLLPLSPPALNPFNNQNYRGQGSQGPHQDNMGSNRGARPNISSRRLEPYNKMGNRNQRPGQKSDERKTSNVSPRVRGPGLSPKNDVQHARNNREERKNPKSDNSKKEVTEDKDKKLNDKQEQEKIRAEFADIPADVLLCHICDKKMGDCVSFMNHIKGKAHLSMMDRQEEQYKAHTEKLRQQMRIEEQQRQLSLGQNNRHGKPPPPNEYCTMCNLKFNGNLTQHRKGQKHQQLKSFLHPRCNLCDKEFATRLDYDHHLLSVGHFKVVANKPKKTDKEDSNQTSKQDKIQKSDNKFPKPEAVIKKPPTTSPVAAVVKIEEEENDSVSNSNESEKEKLPSFDPQKEIGMDMLQEITGYLCRCCNRFLGSTFDAKNHSRSKYHYDKYIEHMKSQPTKSLQQNGSEKSPCNKNKDSNDETKPQADEKTNVSKPENGDNPQMPGEEKMDSVEPEEDEKKDISELEEDNKKDVTEAEEAGKKDVVELEEEEDDDEDESNWKRRKISKDDDLSMDTTLLLNKEDSTEKGVNQDEDMESTLMKDADDQSKGSPGGKAANSPDVNEDLEKTLLLEENPTSSVST